MQRIFGKKSGVWLMVLLVCLIGWYLIDPPEPERCALCDHIKCHAPCLVNLAAGEVGEVTIYEPHRQKVGEVAQEQEGGRLTFLHPAGVRVTVGMPSRTANFSVSKEERSLKKSEFCRSCRKLLSDAESSYVLADLYDPDHPVIYRIRSGLEYDIRCYRVSITEKASEYAVNITGLL